MKSAVLTGILFLLIMQVQAQSGEEIFNSVCVSCHTINKGKLIGPDLSNVYNKQDMPWLISFIRSSQQMIKADDPDAVAIYNEYNKIPMPDNNLSDEQITSIIDYIKTVDEAAVQTTGQADSLTAAADSAGMVSDSGAITATDTISIDENIVRKGRAYFYGNIPFMNNAVSCVSCHNINDGTLFGGGRLALDLTGAYTKLGPAGITAIIKNPPFPAMKQSIKGALTDEEINALNSLFKSASLRNTNIDSFRGISFLVLGLLGGLFIAAFLFLLYDERKIHRGIILK